MLRRWFFNHGISLTSYVGYPLGNAVKLFGESQRWNAKEMVDFQQRALQLLMRHCYDHVPYYSEIMRSRNLHPDDFQAVSDLARLPFLTREIIRREGKRLRASNYADHVCQYRRSGGTTGEPIEVALDARARAFEVAAFLRGLEWMNYRPGSSLIYLFGGSLGLKTKLQLRDRVREWILNMRFLPAFELTPENVGDYYEVIRGARGGTLVGYASAVVNLAEYMSRKEIRGSPLNSIICTAEYMPEEWRKQISDVFGAPVFCYYGCGELNGIAHERVGTKGYLVSSEHVILEVAGEEPSQFSDKGRGLACITSLFNYAMPLIRYLNGDVLELERSDSNKDNSEPLRIAAVEGRTGDQLIAMDGHKVSSALPPHLVFKSGLPVWRYQVVQIDRGEIVFHYVTRDGNPLSPKMQSLMIEVFRKYLGGDLQVSFVVGNFETTKSGKHRFVINKIPPSQRTAT